MMRTATLLVLTGALLVPPWASAQPIETPLVYKVEEGIHGPYEGVWPCTIGSRPEGDWKWPATEDAKALYGVGQLGDLEYAFLFFRSKPDLIAPDRLVFDANGNRDLTDDPVLESSSGTQRGEDLGARFPRMNLTIQVEGKDRPYACFLMAYCHNPGLISRLFENLSGSSRKDAFVALTVSCYYESTFSLGGKERTIRFKDMNANGRFDDTFRPQVRPALPQDECDTLSILGAAEEERRVPLPDILGIGDTVSALGLDFDAGQLSLTPVTENTCLAKVAPYFKHLVLQRARGKKTVALIEPASSLSLPVGEYALQFYEMEKDDGAGGAWLARGRRAGEQDSVTLSGPEAALPFGEPFTSKLDAGAIERGLFGGPYSDLDFQTIGAGGERISSIVHRTPAAAKDGARWNYERPPAPRFKITLADGEVVAEGAFRYG